LDQGDSKVSRKSMWRRRKYIGGSMGIKISGDG
jgi:hypothetical protein